jgi:ADP-heptose:LPS heptosyltransferase
VTSPDVPLYQVRRVCLFARPWHGSLGDFILVNIFLHQLRRAFPLAKITHVVGPAATERFAEFFSAHSYADSIVTCPDHQDDDPGRWARFRSEIRAGSYDCAIIDPASRDLLAEQAARCGIGIRIGLSSGGAADRFLTAPIQLPPGEHCQPDLLDIARAFAGALGLAVPEPADVVPPFPHRPEPVPALPGPVVAVHPGGAAHWNRRWPLARYGDLCRALAKSEHASFILVGSANERSDLLTLRDAVSATAPGSTVAVSAGESLNRLACLLDQADVLVANDSTPAHMAAALGTPAVVLYGPTTESLWRRVYVHQHAVNHHDLCQLDIAHAGGPTAMPCRFSCKYLYMNREGPYPQCLIDIGVGEVYAAVRRQLSGQLTGQASSDRS